MSEVALHEPFDGSAAPFVDKPHARCDFDLHVKGQLFKGSPGGQVQVAASGPKEVFGFDKCLVFFRAKDPGANQLFCIVGVVNVFCDPEQGLQVTQAPFAFFDIGLHHVTRTLLQVAGIALVEFCSDEFSFGTGKKL